MSFSRDIGTCPSCTAVFSGAVKYWPGLTSISMSSPALAAATVEWVPPQSDITNPLKPNCRFRIVVSVSRFSHA